jgi:hypothetical protein
MRLDDGNALTINRDNQNRSGWLGRFRRALGIEGVEVLRRFLDNLFEAAFGHCQAAELVSALGGFAEGTLNRSLD